MISSAILGFFDILTSSAGPSADATPPEECDSLRLGYKGWADEINAGAMTAASFRLMLVNKRHGQPSTGTASRLIGQKLCIQSTTKFVCLIS